MAPEQRTTEKPDHTRLGLWLTFAGTILAALIAGVFTVLAAGGDDPPAAATQPTAAQPAPAQPTPQQPTKTAGATTAGTAPAAGGSAVRWHNTVAVQNIGQETALDLDPVPPEAVSNSNWSGDVTVAVAGTHADITGAAFSSPKFAEWERAGTPDFAACRDAATAGVGQIGDVRKGAVICVRTTEHRIARLTVTKLDGPQDTVTFDAVVWES